MAYHDTKKGVYNRGIPPDTFLSEMIAWGRTASDAIFAPNPNPKDIYAHIKRELGPWESLQHRRAAMLEVMRVLAGFESSWNWTEGVDTSRAGEDTPSNTEAGAWQVSYDARYFSPELQQLLDNKGIKNGVQFQKAMKADHPLAMEFVSRLMRFTCKHNGPLYKGDERSAIRTSLRSAEHSIYPWISRSATSEFQRLLT